MVAASWHRLTEYTYFSLPMPKPKNGSYSRAARSAHGSSTADINATEPAVAGCRPLREAFMASKSSWRH